MKRNLAAFKGNTFDLLLIGGGVTGACIARDAARRGLKVALVEKRDFCSATSSAPSKLIHGGLRYLKNFELGLVRESLAERRIWQQIAPHQVRPLPFLLPLAAKNKTTLGIGLTMYDWLAYDRNRLADKASHIPGHKWLKADEAAEVEPVLGAQTMAGAFRYYDCQMRSPDRLALECLIDADEHGAVLANYLEATDFLRDGSAIKGARVRDTFTGESFEITARITVNAAGPWADRVLGLAEQGEASRHLIRSKGIHLITRSITQDEAITVQIPKSLGGGHIFLLPWRGATIIGTTDTPFEGDPDDVRVSEKEITDYLDLINAALPGAKLTRADVTHAYAGLRPLIDKQTDVDVTSSYNASRAAEIVDHEAEEGLAGFLSALGGKWTTSRHLAEQLVDLVAGKLEADLKPCDTATAPLPGGNIPSFDAFMEAELSEHADLPARHVTELALSYGTRADALYEIIADHPAYAESLAAGHDEIAAQIIHAARDEMAMTLEDAVFRRTGLGTLGDPGAEAMTHAAALMARELGWSDDRTQHELQSAHRLFFTQTPEACT